MMDESLAEEKQPAVPAPAGEPGAAQPAPADAKAAPAHKPEAETPVLRSRLVRLLYSIRIRYKIAATITILLILAVASLGIVTFTRQNIILTQEMRSRAEVLVLQLASVGKEGLLTKQDLPVYAAIADIQTRPDVVYAMVLDDEGRVFAHGDLAQKGTLRTGHADLMSMRADGLLFQQLDQGSGASVLDAAAPIILKSRFLKIGVARVGLSEKALHEAIGRQKRIYLWVALGFGIGGLIVSFALARLITRPLDSLQEGIQVVARGDLRRVVAVTSDDEIGTLTTVFNNMILSLREKLLMEKYLSQPTVQSIREHRDVTQLKLGGERKYVTALFSDARGFTALSEKMRPEDVVRLMNVYLNLQAKVIHQFGGTIDKFVGDEVMAIFEGKGNEVNAVRAAFEIQSYCRSLNTARSAAGERTVFLGIGLNNGEVVMGNMGSEDHMDYTVIGDNINIAARICGIAQPGMVLVSNAVVEAVGGDVTLRDQHPVAVKGKDQPIGIAEVTAVRGGARRSMRKATDASATYTLEGFSDEPYSAVIRNISPSGCLLEVDAPVGIGSKMSINLKLLSMDNMNVRATVYHARKQDTGYFVGLCFEDLPAEAQHTISHWIHEVNSEIVEGLLL